MSKGNGNGKPPKSSLKFIYQNLTALVITVRDKRLFSKTVAISSFQRSVLSLIFGSLLALACVRATQQAASFPQKTSEQSKQPSAEPPIIVGAARFDQYLEKLRGKKVALIVNHSSLVGQTHLADTLLAQKIQVVKIFAPEHGFRGTADAGETVQNGLDKRTGLPIISLYGKRKKPLPEDLAEVDVLVFDIQDVGARFYTYISTLFYALEAAGEQSKDVLVLDRPNPLGHFVDGPMLEKGMESFVGIARLPIVHGCTVGELAQLFVGEGMLAGQTKPNLSVVPCANYFHARPYVLPVSPSPNLPNMRAIYLYPSLCLFEGTVASVGRGTDFPFQVVGHPSFPGEFSFTPQANASNKQPLLEGQTCRGFDLSNRPIAELQTADRLNLAFLLDFYAAFPDKSAFFLKNGFFDKLAGTARLRADIVAGKSEAAIRSAWAPGLETFMNIRTRYLLYE